MANLIADNCLFFLSSEYDKDDKNSVLCIINEFYSPDELISAKKTLIIECEKLGISDSITKYKSSRQLSKGDGIQKVIRDLVDIWSVIDLQKGGKTISTFVVDNPKRLPPTDNNSHNFRQLFSLFSHMQKQVTDIGNIVTRIDKKSEVSSALNTSLGSTSLHIPSSPRTLPWSPAPESASLKRKLNTSAQAFFPSKQRKGEDSLPIVVSPSSDSATAAVAAAAAAAATTTISSTSNSASVISPSIITPPSAALLPATSIAGSRYCGFCYPRDASGATPTILTPISTSFSSGQTAANTQPQVCVQRTPFSNHDVVSGQWGGAI